MKYKITLLINALLLCLCIQLSAGLHPKCQDMVLTLQSKSGDHCVLQSSDIKATGRPSEYLHISNLDEQPHSIAWQRDQDSMSPLGTDPIVIHLFYICNNHPKSMIAVNIEQKDQHKHWYTRAPSLTYSALPTNMAAFTVQKGICSGKQRHQPAKVSVIVG